MGAMGALIFVFFFFVLLFYGSLLWVKSEVVDYRNKNGAKDI